MSMEIVTRFAPSPTGNLHLGHAYSALIAEREARFNNGKFLLRIEDIDIERCNPAFEESILEDLSWLKLEWPEPIRKHMHVSECLRSASDVIWMRRTTIH